MAVPWSPHSGHVDARGPTARPVPLTDVVHGTAVLQALVRSATSGEVVEVAD